MVLGDTGNDDIHGNALNNFLQGNQGEYNISAAAATTSFVAAKTMTLSHFDQGSIVFGDRGSDLIDGNQRALRWYRRHDLRR